MANDLQAQIEKRKRKIAKQIRAIIAAALNNEDGFQRLRAITDEEWQAAVETDELESEPNA